MARGRLATFAVCSVARERLEAPQLLAVELEVLGERHHHALDPHALAAGEVADERVGLAVRHADAADAGVDADVDRERSCRRRGGRALSASPTGV